jgi:endonuclease IV
MGDISVYNDAGLNDGENTVTSYNGQVTRISEVLKNLEDLINSVENNTAAVQNMAGGASENFDSFKEVEDNVNIEDFLAAFEGDDDG